MHNDCKPAPAGFIYYAPMPKRLVGDSLAALGLGTICGGGFVGAETQRGPDGLAGTVFAPKLGTEPTVPTQFLGYYPERQTWRSAPGGLHYVGTVNVSPPAPEALLRRDALQGHAVEMAEGRLWHVPIARGWTEQENEVRWYINLPRRSRLNAEGQWEAGDVVERYARLFKIACDFWDSALGCDQSGRFEFGDAHAAAVEVLATNYLLGPVEADMLGILSDASVRKVLEALIDWPAFIELARSPRPTPPAA